MESNKDLSLHYPLDPAYDSCMVTSFLKGIFARCREKKNTPELVIADTITDLRAEVDMLNADRTPELSADYLLAIERSLPDTAFRYVVLYKDKAPALFVYFQLFTLTSQSFNLEQDKRFIRGILGFFLMLKKARVLIMGNALRTETHGYCFDANKLNKEEAIAAITGIAEKLAADDNAIAMILKDLQNTTTAEQKIVQGMGYAMPWKDQVMEMDIDPAWHTVQDYTAMLSRKYKTRANKILTSARPLRTHIFTPEDAVRYEPDIKRLFAAVVEKQSFTLTSYGANNIAALKQLHKEHFDVVGFFAEDKLVAFHSAFISADSYELYYVGLDYEANNEYQLYFNLLLSGLERAITLRKKLIKLGRTSFDAKASLGAKAKTAPYLIKIIHLPDAVIKWFSCYFSSLEDAKWKLRNPLKTENPKG